MTEENTVVQESYPEHTEGFPIETTEETISRVLENLSVSLGIELAKKKISINELGALKMGQIIELNKRPGDPIDLVVGGKCIGQGELVNVEGELGIRITFLAR